MADFGVTPTGFKLKRLSDVLDEMVAELSSVVDPVTGESLTPDLADENDPLVQVVNALSDQLAVVWEQLELAHNQFDPLKAVGASLSSLVQLNGIRRKPGTKSSVVLHVTGTPGTILVAGRQVTDMQDTNVWVLPQTTIDGNGEAFPIATASVEGPTSAPAGSLVKILTPVTGWVGVTNPADALPGVNEETDTELRLRQQESTATPSQSVIESIYSGLVGIDGVSFARVYQNITFDVDSRGLPGKSIAAVVMGGDNSEIAETIFNRLPVGAATHGTTEVPLFDVQNIMYPIKFTRPTPIIIHVSVEVKVSNAALWPNDGPEKVKAAIVAFAALGVSAFGIQSGFSQAGYLPGQTVFADDLYIPIRSVPGIQIVEVLVGISAPPLLTEVAIDWDEIASIAGENITVSVV